MPPRLGHKKSRLGCTACKRRRVKCDEQRPCGACIRYGWSCSLLDTPSPTRSISHTNGTSSALSSESHEYEPEHEHEPEVLPVSPPTPRRDEPMETRTSFWLQDLELLHHFSTSTWRTMSHEKHFPDLWHITVPSIACRNEFLMHGVLAVSALHLAHLHPTRRRHYYITSTSHQNLAIAGFRNALPHVTQENADAILLASIVIATFAFGAASVKALESHEHFGLNDIIEMLILMRGIEETLGAGSTRDWVKDGPLASMLYCPPESLGPRDPAQEIFYPHLAEVRSLAERHAGEMPAEAATALLDAQGMLEETYEMVLRPRPILNSGLVMWFPNKTSMSFFALIQEENPIALVVFAHFGAMLHFHGERWITDQWARRAVELIKQNIDPEWQKWIEWPASVVERNLKYRDAEPGAYPPS